ncbi:MAG TPA: DUF697 domain-containing protein [Gemmata sp.]|nr:DUF697 domain-containing protein [Gemmata sp.]
MSHFLGALKRLFGGEDRPPDLDATLAELHKKTPVPVLWLIGKTQSGKTSIIKFLTGASDAVIGSGFRPTTRTTRRYEFPTVEAPLLEFLDTRGLDEPGYNPTADIEALDHLAHVVIVTAKATDFAQGNIRAILESIRSVNPSRPVVLCITTLHETFPRQPHPSPYPFKSPSPPNPLSPGERGLGGEGAAIPEDLLRCIEHHAKEFAGLYDVLVPIDLTKPEDGFAEPNYGGEQLKTVLLSVLPDAYRQTLLRLKEATETLKDIHLQHAIPIILGYSTLAATAGGVPMPFVDMVLIPGIQARMAHHLAGVYGQPMTAERFREIAAAVGVGLVSRQLARQATKFIPVVGSAVGAAVGAASTYALGRALCYYFEAVCEGHVPDADSLKFYYQEQYKAAEKKWKSEGNV